MDTMSKAMHGCGWYLDDILIYGVNTEAEYTALGKKKLHEYVTYRPVVNLLKSKLHVYKTSFL